MDNTVTITPPEMDTLPNWGFQHYRFVDLGTHDSDYQLIAIPNFQLPPGWHRHGTCHRYGHLWAVFCNLPKSLSDRWRSHPEPDLSA